MQRKSYTITADHNGVSVKDYIRKVLGVSSRALIDLKKTEGGLEINGAHARSIDMLKTGDVFSIGFPEEAMEYETFQMPLDVVYEDENFIAVNKPAGLAVYPCGKHRVGLLNGVAFYFNQRGESRIFRPFYRLDRDTSGIVVIAKNNIFMSGTVVAKEYFAVCQGLVPEKGVIDEPIGRPDDKKVKRTVGFGQRAVTHFERIVTDGESSLVKLKLETGRTHQIRVHMAFLGAPLWGDDLYGGNLSKINRQALHCKSCIIENPALNLAIKLETPFPKDITEAFSMLAVNERDI